MIIAMAAVIGGCLAYALADWGGWPRLTYDPYAARWSWRSGATPTVPINYYGGLIWAGAGAALGAVIGAVVARWPGARTARARALALAWALTAFGLAGTYYLWNLWPF
ncbi:MAG: hypothetical protein IPL61_11225 [Myxococcales bacterium]|nr:hypothetical protein [Myxococcales bacterium]